MRKVCGHYYSYSDNKFLHRVIWEEINGTIPNGMVIHHINGDPSDNEIKNLKALTPKEHALEHMKEKGWRKSLQDRLDKAIEWSRTPEGRKWHSENSKAENKTRPRDYQPCAQCGKETIAMATNKERFCRLACRRKFFGKTKEVICKVCGKVFSTPTHNYVTHCSRKCACQTIVLSRGDKLHVKYIKNQGDQRNS